MLTWTDGFLISEWVIRLVMLVWVPQRRSPAAARTWLLVILLEPWAGVFLYALFGRAYLPRRRRERIQHFAEQLRASATEWLGAHVAPPEGTPVQVQRAITLAEHLGYCPVTYGNRVELLSDYAGSIRRLVEDVGAARDHVHLLYYIFADDKTGRQVAEALGAAAKRGVRCRVLIDSLASKKCRQRLAPEMRAAGVEVVELLPAGLLRRNSARLDLRNHRKIAVVDGRIGYVGSQNIVDADFKKGLVYEELVARVTGPVVRQLQTCLLADRFLETGAALAGPELYPSVEPAGVTPAQVLASGPGFSQENNQRLIVVLVHGAQSRVVITTPYFIPDEPLQQALQTAALRGVDVHLVVSRQIDQFLVGLAQRSYYEEMLEAGVRIHQYHRRFLHAKHLSVDDAIALVGSSNMDIRSFALNAEVSLLVYDPKVVAELRAVQEQYFANADLITLEEWRRRPFLTRTVQNMARMVDSIL